MAKKKRSKTVKGKFVRPTWGKTVRPAWAGRKKANVKRGKAPKRPTGPPLVLWQDDDLQLWEPHGDTFVPHCKTIAEYEVTHEIRETGEQSPDGKRKLILAPYTDMEGL